MTDPWKEELEIYCETEQDFIDAQKALFSLGWGWMQSGESLKKGRCYMYIRCQTNTTTGKQGFVVRPNATPEPVYRIDMRCL